MVLAGYMKFVKMNYKRIVKENPKASFGKIGKLMGAEWRSMSEAQKSKYGKVGKKK